MECKILNKVMGSYTDAFYDKLLGKVKEIDPLKLGIDLPTSFKNMINLIGHNHNDFVISIGSQKYMLDD